MASRILEDKFCVLGLGLGLECPGLGLEGPGLGLEGPGLGLGLGLECPGLGLGLGLECPDLDLALASNVITSYNLKLKNHSQPILSSILY